MLGIIIPIDVHIFQRGGLTTNQMCHFPFSLGLSPNYFITAIMYDNVQVPKFTVAQPSPGRWQESNFLQFCHQRLWKSGTLAGGAVLTAGPFRWEQRCGMAFVDPIAEMILRIYPIKTGHFQQKARLSGIMTLIWHQHTSGIHYKYIYIFISLIIIYIYIYIHRDS